MQNYTIKAHLVNGSYANFYEKFHKSEIDPFYTKIQKICDTHAQITRADPFKTPYNVTGFYFKAEPYIKCIDKHKKPCIIDNLYDTDIIVTVKVTPYDLIDKITKQRRAGVSIKLMSVKGI